VKKANDHYSLQGLRAFF